MYNNACFLYNKLIISELVTVSKMEIVVQSVGKSGCFQNGNTHFLLEKCTEISGVNSNLTPISLQSFSFPSVSHQCFISLRENLLGFI